MAVHSIAEYYHKHMLQTIYYSLWREISPPTPILLSSTFLNVVFIDNLGAEQELQLLTILNALTGVHSKFLSVIPK